MCDNGYLGELCSLPVADCAPGESSAGIGNPWHPMGVVEDALWKLASRSSVADLVGTGGGGGRGRDGGSRMKANYFDCLYAFHMAGGNLVEAAEAQDELRKRWAVFLVLCFLRSCGEAGPGEGEGVCVCVCL